MPLRFAAELWEHDGEGGWHFVSVPPDLGDEIRSTSVRRGFGSVRVRATIGDSTWTTSVFPSRQGSYVLPVKRAVRDGEGVEAGDVVDVVLELL
jgi:hypothetical protein